MKSASSKETSAMPRKTKTPKTTVTQDKKIDKERKTPIAKRRPRLPVFVEKPDR